jgi:LDH2 family malate/lactate/ureidoglycolate dehydrogenase
MPEFEPAYLRGVGRRIFEAAGAPPDIAEHVADHLVAANLAGHDSHGVIRIPWYLDHVRRGWIRPGARPRLLHDRPAAALVSGEWGFGHPAAVVAMDAACERARRSGLGAAGVLRATHLGLGAARAAVPYGGRSGIYGTNPMSFAFPGGSAGTLLLDYATTAIAGGKVMVARDTGVPLPEGYVVDREGRPSTDPNDFLEGGALLPFGGHKGYALAFFAQLLGQALVGGDTTAGEGRDDGPFGRAGAFFLAVDPGLFRPAEEAIAVAERFASEARSVPPAPGFERVLAPGDPEAWARRERARAIPLPEQTWRDIAAAAESLGVALSA